MSITSLIDRAVTEDVALVELIRGRKLLDRERWRSTALPGQMAHTLWDLCHYSAVQPARLAAACRRFAATVRGAHETQQQRRMIDLALAHDSPLDDLWEAVSSVFPRGRMSAEFVVTKTEEARANVRGYLRWHSVKSPTEGDAIIRASGATAALSLVANACWDAARLDVPGFAPRARAAVAAASVAVAARAEEESASVLAIAARWTGSPSVEAAASAAAAGAGCGVWESMTKLTGVAASESRCAAGSSVGAVHLAFERNGAADASADASAASAFCDVLRTEFPWSEVESAMRAHRFFRPQRR